MTRPASGARYVETGTTMAEWRKYATANGLTGGWVGRAHRYGMEGRDLHALYLRQDGRCYLCGDPLPANLAKTVVVEHDHSCCPGGSSCGKCVRGIACSPCNQLIALAQDDPDRLRRIADKLEIANALVGRPGRIRTTISNDPHPERFLPTPAPGRVA